MNPSEIKLILGQYGISPTKAKGQNFLVDDRVAEREVDYLGIEPADVVMEIGPGLGVLTQLLTTRGRSPT
jgi:16S rRNA (adenine1518-N6/adenine1519-N6)-dimethyltransferase